MNRNTFVLNSFLMTRERVRERERERELERGERDRVERCFHAVL